MAEGKIYYYYGGAPSGGTLWVSEPIGAYNKAWSEGNPAYQVVSGASLPLSAIVWTLDHYEWTHPDKTETYTTTVSFHSGSPFTDLNICDPKTATSTQTTKYVFNGWTNGGTLYKNGDVITLQSGGDVPTVSVNISTSSNSSMSWSSIILPSNSKTHEGYEFVCWEGHNGKETKTYSPGDSVTIYGWDGGVKMDSTSFYAVWKANNYTISFDPNGGSVTPATKLVTYGGTYGALPIPTKIGYRFGGWYDNKNNLISSTSTVNTAADATLHAKWDLAYNTLSFNLNGGEWTEQESASFSRSFEITSNNYTIPKPHKVDSSYKFIGWKTTTANWKILDPNTSYTKDSYVMNINIIPSQVTTWDKTLSFTAYYQQLGKYTRVGGKWHPILKTFVKRNGSWIKTEDVLDPTIGIGKTKMKVNNHWTGEIGSDTK